MVRAAAAWLLPAVAFLLLACGDSQPPLTRLSPDATVLAFGDSLTFGTGAGLEESYPAVLAAITGRNVIRAGVPGEVSADGLRRLPALLEQHRPRLVIICHGGNDILRKLDPQRLRANLRDMIETARAHGAEVLLIGVPEPGLFLSAADHYREVAEELEIPLEAEALAEILGHRSLKSDTIHPNAAGYRKLAQAVADLLRETGAI